MPDLIRDDLIVRILHHIADLCGLIPLTDLLHGNSVKEYLTAFLSVGSKDRL